MYIAFLNKILGNFIRLDFELFDVTAYKLLLFGLIDFCIKLIELEQICLSLRC